MGGDSLSDLIKRTWNPYQSISTHGVNLDFHWSKQLTTLKSTKRLLGQFTKKLPPLLREGALGLPSLQLWFGDSTEAEREAERDRIARLSAPARMRLLDASLKMYELKHPAFKEEIEWRCMSYHMHTGVGPGLPFTALFRAASDRIIPYRPVTLIDLEIPIINKIVIGPKNTTPDIVVRSFLRSIGLENAEVVRSIATYR